MKSNEVPFNRRVIMANTLLGAAGGVILNGIVVYTHLSSGLLIPDLFLYISLGIFWLVNLSIISLIYFEKTRHLVDPSLTRIQMYWAVTCAFFYVALMPKLHEIVYLLILIVVVYGTFRLKPKDYNYFATYIAVLLAIIEGSFVVKKEISQEELFDHIITWVTFAFCLISMASICRSHIKLKNRIKEKNIELRQVSKSKSQFLANVSHELRTPLNGVIGMSSLMAEQSITGDQKKMLEVINTSSNNLLDLINNILDFSKLDSGRIKLDIASTNLDKLVADVYAMTAIRVTGKNIDYNYEIDDNICPNIVCDELRLKQILLNLITNAIKFTEEGFVKLSLILIEKLEAKQKIRFIISDSGIGISQEQQKNIFRRFSQVDDTMTRQYGGTGLGLSISAELARLMEAEIHIDSALEQGAKFWFDVTLSTYENKGRLRNIKI